MVSCTLNKRITIFAGHYGSGKTNVALNYAVKLKDKGFETVIADLDIVNPYFRTKDAKMLLEEKGIHLISSKYASSNVDLPALPAEAYSIIDTDTRKAVIDLGGDDRGALAMGRYTEAIQMQNDYEMLFVVNKYRPLTRTVNDAIAVMKEIEASAKMRFTAIVNNSNIGDETTAENVLDSVSFVQEISEKTNLPIAMTTVDENLYEEIKEKVFKAVPIKIYIKQSWSR